MAQNGAPTQRSVRCKVRMPAGRSIFWPPKMVWDVTDSQCIDNLLSTQKRLQQYTPLTGRVLSISVNSFHREYSTEK